MQRGPQRARESVNNRKHGTMHGTHEPRMKQQWRAIYRTTRCGSQSVLFSARGKLQRNVPRRSITRFRSSRHLLASASRLAQALTDMSPNGVALICAVLLGAVVEAQINPGPGSCLSDPRAVLGFITCIYATTVDDVIVQTTSSCLGTAAIVASASLIALSEWLLAGCRC
jgi:hypothetical protein